MKKEKQVIKCFVEDCKYCDCMENCCMLSKIKICTCSKDKSKEATMCDNYNKK